MWLLFLIGLIVGTWLLLRNIVKQLMGIKEADTGFFEEAVTPLHHKIRIVLSVCYLLLAGLTLYTILDLSLLPAALRSIAGLMLVDGVIRMYFELNHGKEPRRAALTLCDTVLIVGAILFGVSQIGNG